MNQMKNEKGVTLALLVITIVIMLILAGVTIVSTLGNNGVMQHTMNTTNKVDEYQKAKENAYNTLIEGLN